MMVIGLSDGFMCEHVRLGLRQQASTDRAGRGRLVWWLVIGLLELHRAQVKFGLAPRMHGPGTVKYVQDYG